MKFTCGETYEAWRDRLGNWHPFFTLLPRTVGEKNGKDVCAWLEWIERRLDLEFLDNHYSKSWEYREKP